MPATFSDVVAAYPDDVPMGRPPSRRQMAPRRSRLVVARRVPSGDQATAVIRVERRSG